MLVRYSIVELLMVFEVSAQCEHIIVYCILRGRIKGYNSSITTIMCQGGTVGRIIFKDIKFQGYSKFHFK